MTMRLIKSSFEIYTQEAGLDGIYKAIEKAGRICYKSSPKYRWYSEDRTRWINEETEDWRYLKNDYPIKGENISAKPFVDRMIASGHGAMLEHGTVYLQFKGIIHCFGMGYQGGLKYLNNPHSKVVLSEKGAIQYVTTNYRVLVENGWLDDLEYLCEPTEHHEKRVTAHFILPIGISREFCRHRVFSFAEMSTRYYNFNKNKFGNELTFIEDKWSNHSLLQIIENEYMKVIERGFKPQEARNILPLCTKTELVMTGFVSDWKHFFELRCASNAHPQAQELAIPLREEFINRKIW